MRSQDPEGAEPGDLPIEQPTQFEIVVNSEDRDEIAIIPESILLRADEVIR